MVRTIKDASVKSLRYVSITDWRRHVRDGLLAHNDAKPLMALRFTTPFEAIRQISVTSPQLFARMPRHDRLGPNT